MKQAGIAGLFVYALLRLRHAGRSVMIHVF